MRLVFTSHGWDDYQHWVAKDRATLKRLNRLIEDTLRSPFDGVGKPERLRHLGPDVWSRRITEEHRLVYLAATDGSSEELVILQARLHY